MTIIDNSFMSVEFRPNTREPTFVSQQVQRARRFFLDLEPDHKVPITVVCGGCERLQPDYLIERATFPFYCIEFVAEGQGFLELAGNKYPLQRGSVFSYFAKTPHKISTNPQHPMLKYYVNFVGSTSWKLMQKSPLAGGNHVSIYQPEQILQLYEMLLQEGLAVETGYQEICASILKTLILKIIQLSIKHEATSPTGYMTYLDIKQYIDQHCLTLWKIDELATHFQTSSAQICRLFQAYAQTTPFKYLIRLKMQEAAALLLDEHLLVKEVAYRLGYTDPFHFSRVFKRIYGISPELFVHNMQH